HLRRNLMPEDFRQNAVIGIKEKQIKFLIASREISVSVQIDFILAVVRHAGIVDLEGRRLRRRIDDIDTLIVFVNTAPMLREERWRLVFRRLPGRRRVTLLRLCLDATVPEDAEKPDQERIKNSPRRTEVAKHDAPD